MAKRSGKRKAKRRGTGRVGPATPTRSGTPKPTDTSSGPVAGARRSSPTKPSGSPSSPNTEEGELQKLLAQAERWPIRLLFKGIVRDSRLLGTPPGSAELTESTKLVDEALARMLRSPSDRQRGRGIRLYNSLMKAREERARTETELAVAAFEAHTWGQLSRLEKRLDETAQPDTIESLSAMMEDGGHDRAGSGQGQSAGGSGAGRDS